MCSLTLIFLAGFYFIESGEVLEGEEEDLGEGEEEGHGTSEQASKDRGVREYRWGETFNLFLFIMIPAGDTITDLAYLLTSSFYRVGYFYAAVVAFMIPNLAFGVLLYQRNRMLLRPKHVPASLKFEAHDNLGKMAVACVLYKIVFSTFFVTLHPTILARRP